MSEDHQSNDPWHLISAHQYEKAIAAYDAILAAGENYHAIVANRAIALLCLGLCLKRWRVLQRQMTSLVGTGVHPNRRPTYQT